MKTFIPIKIGLIVIIGLAILLPESAFSLGPEYVPNEVLVNFKEGAIPSQILEKANIKTTKIKRIHSIEPVVQKYLKKEKLEKDKDGWFWFRGKEYQELKSISDEEIFQKAYIEMSLQRKQLYRTYEIKLPEEISVKEAVAILEQNPQVEYAQPNYIYEATQISLPDARYIPNDYYIKDGTNWRKGAWEQAYPDLWGLRNTQAIEALNMFDSNNDGAFDEVEPIPGKGVIVAVIDTGVDYNHPDIRDNIWINPDVIREDYDDNGEINFNDVIYTRDFNGNGVIDDDEILDHMFGWDFAYETNDPIDRGGHGTHCAGTIAAVGNNDIGIIGVAPYAKIMMLKGLDDTGRGSSSTMAQCFKYAAEHGAKVLSNSWGMSTRYPEDQVMKNEVDYAYDVHKCVIVFAAGNGTGGGDDVAFYYPQNDSKTICVAAMTHTDKKADFSYWGSLVDIGAPGGNDSIDPDHCNILSLNAIGGDNRIARARPELGVGTEESKDYLRLAGTSMACPHVAGAAALIISYNEQVHLRTPTPEETRQILRLSADPIPDPFEDGTNWMSPNPIVGAGRLNIKRALEVSDVSNIPLVKITSPVNFSNFAGQDYIVLEGSVKAEEVASKEITLEYTYYQDLDHTTSPNTPPEWVGIPADISFDPGDPTIASVQGMIGVLGASPGWFAIRLKVGTAAGIAYDTVVVKIDYLELFEVVKPDFEQYGYKEDFLLGQFGPLKIAFSIPYIDYVPLGGPDKEIVKLTVRIKNRSVPGSAIIELGSVINPSAGTWNALFDTTQFQDGFYQIFFDKKITIGDNVYSETTTFKNITGSYYHVNNAHIYDPHHGAVFNSEHSGPIQVSGYSVLPINRVEAGVGIEPAGWVEIDDLTIIPGSNGNYEFSGKLNPGQFSETLINIRLINDIGGQYVENDRTAIIVDPSIASGWPQRSRDHQARFKLVLGDVSGDGKDDIVIATNSYFYYWTIKELFQKEKLINTLSRCYVYQNNGQINMTYLNNSKATMHLDTDETMIQAVLNVALADLDDNPGQEIVTILWKTASLYFNRNELLALTEEGLPPQEWQRLIDEEFNYSEMQRLGIVDIDRDGKSEIFFDRMIGNPFEVEDRWLYLVNHKGEIIIEKDVAEFFPDIPDMSMANTHGDLLACGNIEQDKGQEIFINVNIDTLEEEYPHPLFLNANGLDIIRELTPSSQLLSFGSPLVGNLDDDKAHELMFIGREEGVNNSSIYAYNIDGSAVPNWPYSPLQDQDNIWKIKEFKLIDIDRNGKVEILVREYCSSGTQKRGNRLKLISSEGNPSAIWSVDLPSSYTLSLERAVVLDIDDDGEMEFIVLGDIDNNKRLSYKDGLGKESLGAHTYFSPYLLIFFESNGSISQIKHVPGKPYIALGNIDDDASTELVAAYCYGDINMQEGQEDHKPGLYLEVVAFDLDSIYKRENIHWSQFLGNAQHSNIYEEPAPIYGDVNDDKRVTMKDAMAVAQYAIGLGADWDNDYITRANVDESSGNGRDNITMKDAILIARRANGIRVLFPVED